MKSFEVVALSDLGYQVVLHDAPPWCRPLQMAPDALEPDLTGGNWLVLVFAVWSVPDVEAIEVVLSAAESIGPSVSVGIRPFDDSAEMRTWLPDAVGRSGSPIWALLVDGRIVWSHEGGLTARQLLDVVEDRLDPGAVT